MKSLLILAQCELSGNCCGRKGGRMMTIVPCTFSDAAAFVDRFHRHHKPPVGNKFSIAVAVGERVVGVAIVGRPVSRMLQDGWTLEVTRCCSDGTPNACSKLYGACRRAAWALGYRRLVTYTLPQEGGVSLRAAGYRCIGEVGGGAWSRKSRPRIDKAPLEKKWRWEASSC